MTTRRNFLRLGALFVPALAAPTVAYSFLNGAGIPRKLSAKEWIEETVGRRRPYFEMTEVCDLNGVWQCRYNDGPWVTLSEP